MALDDKRDKKGLSFTPMMIEEDSVRNGRGLSDQWADTMVVRPRTTERHITVHKKLVLGFAISILALIIVTIIAVLLSVRFEECATGSEGSHRTANSSLLASDAKVPPHSPTASNDASPQKERKEEEEDAKPWLDLRLPTALQPLHYNLMLTTFMDNFTFSGEVGIAIECLNFSRFLVLHADTQLKITRVQLSADGRAAPSALNVTRTFFYPPNQVFVMALSGQLEPQKRYNLRMSYHARIDDDLLGFYRSSYVIDGERRSLAVTQFSPTHARKSFPCFDEPIFKATFKISIKHQKSYVSLSNMPVETTIMEDDGWVTDFFEQTPPMSTYYLAWAVCDFTYRETFTKNDIGVRLYARPDAVRRGSGDYALNITKKLLEFYEDYFKVPYSLPKLDLLAVPKHPYAAMENWGLSVFVEQKMLLDPTVSSIPYLLDVTMVIVHEICHQWFGDLVTPVWWEDVWLKEGFAHYFEYVGTDYLYPGWNMEKQRFLTDVLHEVMLLDGLSSSHPISQEVLQATDIDRVFDWIAYKKGAALIRMLANFMGHQVFQLGLQDYLTTHMFGNAARNDLWNKLSKALQMDGKTINVSDVMDRWTTQMGYPLVTIVRSETVDNILTISQQHFIYDIDAKSRNPELANISYLWKIPLSVAVGNASHMSSSAVIWVSNKTEQHRVHGLDGRSWLLGNINQTGYFRVNYDIRNWRLLIDQLMKNHEVISVGNRAGLIDDAFNLARAGYLPQNIPLEIIRYLSKEKEFLPWHAASRVLYPLDKLLDRTADCSIFNKYVLKQVTPMYAKLGWPTSNLNGSFVQAFYQTEELRRELIMLACSFGSKNCHQQAITLISEWMSSNKNRIPPNVRDIVYCTGVSLMEEDVWEFLWMKFHSSTAVSEKKILLEALTCSDNKNLLNKLLNLSLNSDVVAEQDAIDVIIHVARNPQGRNLAWRFFKDKWTILHSRYGEALFMTTKLVSGVTEFLNTERELNELNDFIRKHGGGEGSTSSFTRAVEIVEANVRWHTLYKEQLFQWLRNSLSS